MEGGKGPRDVDSVHPKRKGHRTGETETRYERSHSQVRSVVGVGREGVVDKLRLVVVHRGRARCGSVRGRCAWAAWGWRGVCLWDGRQRQRAMEGRAQSDQAKTLSQIPRPPSLQFPEPGANRRNKDPSPWVWLSATKDPASASPSASPSRTRDGVCRTLDAPRAAPTARTLVPTPGIPAAAPGRPRPQPTAVMRSDGPPVPNVRPRAHLFSCITKDGRTHTQWPTRPIPRTLAPPRRARALVPALHADGREPPSGGLVAAFSRTAAPAPRSRVARALCVRVGGSCPIAPHPWERNFDGDALHSSRFLHMQGVSSCNHGLDLTAEVVRPKSIARVGPRK